MDLQAPASGSRRRFLKLALSSGLLLAGVGSAHLALSPSSKERAEGFELLRTQDVPFLTALIPVILAGAVSRARLTEIVNPVLERIDNALLHVSPAALALIQELFDVTSNNALRGPITGVWSRWENASGAEIDSFLKRWRDSPIALLRQGHAALLQAVLLAWYDSPAAWQHCGYPGPPAPFNGAAS